MYLSIRGDYNNFQKQLIIQTPKLGTDKINQLKADWVQMQSKEDYNKIMQSLNEIEPIQEENTESDL